MSLLRPFRGTFTISGVSEYGSSKESSQNIRITAAEIAGDSRTDLWPSQFFVSMTSDRSTLNTFRSWVKRNAPPVCTFMPDRIRDPHSSAVNQKNFGSLSRILLMNQSVAIAPWNLGDGLPGGGIVLYPSQNSSNLLYGAVFLTAQLPDFLTMSPDASYYPLPNLQSPRQPSYYPSHSQYSSSYAPTQYDNSSGYPTSGYPSPTSGSSPLNYPYTIPRLVPDGSLPSPTTVPHYAWSNYTDEESI